MPLATAAVLTQAAAVATALSAAALGPAPEQPPKAVLHSLAAMLPAGRGEQFMLGKQGFELVCGGSHAAQLGASSKQQLSCS